MAPRDANAAALVPLSNYSVTVNYGGMTPQGSGWFGPLQPLAPVAPLSVTGRRFDFASGFNVNVRPRTYERIGFPELRALADNYDLLRIVIETRKDQLERLPWRIAPREDEFGEGAGEPSTALKNRAKEIRDFFKKPDTQLRFPQWLRALLEDLFVIDAPTIYRRPTRGGGLYSLEVIDGATIKPVIDDWGRVPLPPNPAYQQVIKGLPATNYTTKELIYRPRNVRANKVYGFAPVEQVLMTVNIALRRQLSQMQYYTEGNIPEALIGVPETWTPQQITAFQTYWDEMLEGNLEARRHAKFVPGGVAKTFIPTKEPELKNVFDEWLARVVCFAFSISSQPFVSQVNRATAETAQEQSLEDGLEPIKQWAKDLIDDIVQNDFGETDLEFLWGDGKKVDPDAQATRLGNLTGNGLMRLNEGRKLLGYDPDPDPAADTLMVKTASGFVPVGANTLDAKKAAQEVLGPPLGPEENDQQEDGESRPPKLRKARKRTLYVMRPLINADDLVAWAKAQGFGKALTADDMHVTVAFSRAKVDWSEVAEPTIDVRVPASESRSLERLGDKGAIGLRFESSILATRWRVFRDAGASWDWPGYKPHVTITYDAGDIDIDAITPYNGELLFGPEQFAEVDEDWSSNVTEKHTEPEVGKLAGGPFVKAKMPRGWRALAPISAERKLARNVKSDLQKRIAKQLRVTAGNVAEAVGVKLAHVAKADEDDEERRARIERIAQQIAADVDLEGLDAIADVTADELERLTKDTGARVLAQLGVMDQEELVDQVNDRAVEMARDHAADLVGKRWVDGELVDNPNAEYAIDDTTRDMLRATIADGLEQNLGRDEIIDSIVDSYGFSEERAELIAVTEIARANSDAALMGYRAARDEAGVNSKKVWLTAEDDLVDEDVCVPNGDAGPIDLDDAFPSGDDAPPGHPRCRCALSAAVEDDSGDAGDEGA